MGTSAATLQIYGAEAEKISALLPKGFLLRENDSPWLRVLPEEYGALAEQPQLEKLAKRLTKADDSLFALVFSYFDDDVFHCALYKGGKTAASCGSDGSWAKLGKALDGLIPDLGAAKAFRLASHCADLDEKLRLLEETLGAALLDCADAEPRTVPRSDHTLNAIKARESALRKRPNQYALRELAPQDWPPDWRAQLGLYDRVRVNWERYDANHLLSHFGSARLSVPRHPELAFHEVTFGGFMKMEHRFLLWSQPDKKLSDRRLPGLDVSRVLWITARGEPVCLASEYWIEQRADSAMTRIGRTFLGCLAKDGSFRWTVILPQKGYGAKFCHAAADGTLTLYLGGNSYTGEEGIIYRVNAENGATICSRSLPIAENMQELAPVEALHGFLYVADRRELVLLDEALQETARFDCGRYFSPYRLEITGSVVWDQDYNDMLLRKYDLKTGGCTTVKPEIPTYVQALLPDGCFLGTNEQQTQLTVFDPGGRVISRHKAQRYSHFAEFRAEGDKTFLLELRSPIPPHPINGIISPATTLHVHQLERV